MKLFRINRKDGFSLLEAIVAIAVMTIVGVAMTRLNVTSMKANKSTMIRTDLEDIKRTIANTISCDNTLGVVKPTTCSGPVELKDKLGANIATGGKIGPWDIEATCEVLGGKNGLSIYATKRYPNGEYMIDPLREIPLDKTHPISELFNPDVRLCADNFKSTVAPAYVPITLGDKKPFDPNCDYRVSVSDPSQNVYFPFADTTKGPTVGYAEGIGPHGDLIMVAHSGTVSGILHTDKTNWVWTTAGTWGGLGPGSVTKIEARCFN